MIAGPHAIIDGEIHALWELASASPIGRGRRTVEMLLRPERRMEKILSGSLAENLQGCPPTKALQKHIAHKLLRLFWTILPEEDERWLQASTIAHEIAEAVMHELGPLQREEVDPFSLKE